MSSGAPSFAATDEQAAERFAVTRHRDPFPEIAPALLNTADLLDYVAATGMVHPFEVNLAEPSTMLKPASCGIRLGGEVVFWEIEDDGKLRKEKRTLGVGEKLTLKQNAIVYVTLEATLRLPDYIAARFNLTIRDIYRGILVGTGPLVDPGFQGQLHLPLHNLTTNEYTLEGGEPIVWMEFTKLSPHPSWSSDGERWRLGGDYVPFPSHKLSRRTIEQYLSRASAEPVVSSIPSLVGRAERSARDAQASARRFFGFSLAAALAVVIGIATVVVSVYGLVDSEDTSRQALQRQVDSLEHRLEDLRALQSEGSTSKTSR